jgi:RHS repeat-associated protein
MITSARRAALSCALLATTALCGLTAQPAAAQSGITPSSRPAPDANGVDVITGELNVPLQSVSIGRPGESGLTYSTGIIDGAKQDTFVLEAFGGGNVALVNIHGRTVSFTRNSAGVYVPDDADGSTFTPWADDFVYTARDGTRIEFINDYSNGPGEPWRGDRIIRPDGEEIRYHYKVAPQPPCPTDDPCLHPDGNGGVRVQSITSNLGYQIKATYLGNDYATDPSAWTTLSKVTAINSAVEFCRSTDDTCTLSPAWPTLELVRVQSGSTAVDKLKDNLENTVTVTSGDSGPTAIASPANPAADITLTYNDKGRVATVTRGAGTWGYDYLDDPLSRFRTTTVTQPLVGSRTYVSDLHLKRVVSEKDELDRTTSYKYDANGRLERTTFHEGNYIELEYDTRGNVKQTRRVEKSGTGAGDIVSTAMFPLTCTNQKICNKPASVTDARGNTTDFLYYENHGGLRRATGPLPSSKPGAVRPQVRMEYSSFFAQYKNHLGNIVPALTPVHRLTATSACQTLAGAEGDAAAACAGTADEVKSTIAYGSTGVANNLLPDKITSTDGLLTPTLTATEAMTYDAVGNLLTVNGPLAGDEDIVRFHYDAVRRPVGSVSPDPDGPNAPLKHRAQRNTYNEDGNVIRVESGTVEGQSDSQWTTFSPLQAAETSYDLLGRPVTSKLIAGGTTYALTQMNYDAKGRPLCTAQRMDTADFGASLPDACTLTSNAGNHGPDRIKQTIYDKADQVTAVLTALGTAEQANEAAYTYRPNGQIETASDGEGRTTTYAYDGHDRLKSTAYPATAQHPATSETLSYENVGGGVQNSPLVATMINRSGETIALSYDALGRVTVKDVPNSAFVFDSHYRYDNLGRVTSIGTDANSTSMGFGYDALGRMTQETHATHGNKSFGYDLAGRRTHMAWKDDVRIDYSYLVTGEMKTIFEAAGVPNAMTLATFDYDNRGNRTKLTRGNGTVTDYTPDPVSRLGALKQSFAAAAAANDLTLDFTYNPAGQIVTNTRSNELYSWAGATPSTIASTANALNQIATHGGVTFSYDAKGNLQSDGTRSYSYDAENRLKTAGTASFFYDALGRLSWHTGLGSLLDYEGSRLVTELQGGTHAILRRYVHGPGSDEPLVWYEGAGTATRRWLHADERDSIIAISDAGGAVTARNRYDEYGLPAGNNVGRFQYTGQKWLPQVGLYDHKARTYDPRLGRFLQSDPIGYGDGMNLYAYVAGDPINWADTSGLGKEKKPDKGKAEKEETEEEDPIVVVGRRLAAGLSSGIMWIGNAYETVSEIPSNIADYALENAPEEIVIVGQKVQQINAIASRIGAWLQTGYRVIPTPRGNIIFESNDQKRRVRFDWNPPKQGRWNGPHVQFEVRGLRGIWMPAPGLPAHIHFKKGK